MYQEYKSAWAALIAPGADFEITTTNVNGVNIRTYANAVPNLRDAWAATAAYADREYLVYEDERLTYAQAHEHVNSLGNWLIAQGVQPGDRVAIAMRNYPEWMLSYWGILSVGATVVGMNAWWTGSEMLYALEDSTPNVIIADEERLPTLNDIKTKLPKLKIIGVRLSSAQDGVSSWSDVIANPAPIPQIAIDPDSDACIFYTSGTTGNPKGAQLTHRGCTSNIWSLMFAAALQRVLSVQKGLIEADAEPPIPSALVTTPLFHVTANNCVAHGTTLAWWQTHSYV
jgi:long-chain acyl-CoA synthetase